MNKGDLITVSCIDLDVNGYGLAQSNQILVLVPNLLPGENAHVKLCFKKNEFWVASIDSLLSRSVNRVIPRCIHADECGSCSLQHLNINGQLDYKFRYLNRTLRSIGKVTYELDSLIQDINKDFEYRNRAIIPITYNTTNQSLDFGYYKLNSHNIVNIYECPVLDKRIESLLVPLREIITKFTFQERNVFHTELLRHISLRVSQTNGKIMITFVTKKIDSQKLINLARIIYQRFDHVTSITHNIQSENTNVIFGPSNRLLIGDKYIEEEILGVKLSITANTFFQVNTSIFIKVIKLIIAHLPHEPSSNTIVDAYCGVGSITLPLASLGYNVTGIEINPESIYQANINRVSNDITNAHFICGDVANALTSILNSSRILIVDPPRKGLSNRVVESIIKCRPSYIFYLSCSPSTLSRDLNKLVNVSKLYRIELIQPFDFFPHTTHIETLVYLTLSNS